MAFVNSVNTSSFVGNRLQVTANVSPLYRPSIDMSFGAMDKVLAKYSNMSNTPYQPPVPSPVSRVWSEYRKTSLARFLPSRAPATVEETYEQMMVMMRFRASRFNLPGGAPNKKLGETYMAKCVANQYKATACSNGTYSVRCTEGTVSGQADLARIASLAQDFRAFQRTPSQKFADMYENRRLAISAAHGCTYEENLLSSYNNVASAFVRGREEAMGSCSRYTATDAANASPAEQYMSRCVDAQVKRGAVASGVYGTACMDGSVSGMAENKRIVAMSAAYRMGQISKIAKQQRMYDVRRHAVDTYAHMCSYEEDLFNKYPAVATAMSGAFDRS